MNMTNAILWALPLLPAVMILPTLCIGAMLPALSKAWEETKNEWAKEAALHRLHVAPVWMRPSAGF